MHQRSFGDWSVDLEAKNAQDTHKAGKKAARYGGGLACWFTVIALGILNFGIGVEEAHWKSSGMEETAWIGKFDFELGLASTLSFRFGEAWQRFCNTSCRLEYHGKKHGKPYLPKKLYQARRREAGKGVVGLFG